MNRIIKFRGLRTDGLSNDFIVGSLIIEPNNRCWIDWFDNGNRRTTEVIPETVGQFTGLTDKNGKEIYDGDKLYSIGYLCTVIWSDCCFRTVYEHPEDGETLILMEDINPLDMEIIGNIHENK